MSHHRRRIRWRSDAGQAAGIETIPFGILVFVAGTVLVVNAWAVVDTRAAVDTAARDYLRTYTSAGSAGDARAAGRAAALRSLGERGSHVRITDPSQPFGACLPATVRVELTVEAIRAPFIGSIGTTTVTATETELVQPNGDAPKLDGQRTACDG